MFENSDNSTIKKYVYGQFIQSAGYLSLASVFYLLISYGFFFLSILFFVFAFISFSKAIFYSIYVGWKNHREFRNEEINELTFFKLLTLCLILITITTFGVLRSFVAPPNGYYGWLFLPSIFTVMSFLLLSGAFVKKRLGD